MNKKTKREARGKIAILTRQRVMKVTLKRALLGWIQTSMRK